MTSCLQCGHDDPAGFTFCPRCGTRAVEAVGKRDPLLGLILNGKYRVESEIGVGAMGRVYLGEHIGLKKRVALKVLHSDLQVSDESLQRFQREGIAAGKFSHPHAIQIFDFDRSDGRVFYLAMEFIDGVNLGCSCASADGCPSTWRFCSRCRWPRAWPRPTSTASCTATSSPRTSWSARARAATCA
jgi:serine/threonine-protein kinase